LDLLVEPALNSSSQPDTPMKRRFPPMRRLLYSAIFYVFPGGLRRSFAQKTLYLDAQIAEYALPKEDIWPGKRSFKGIIPAKLLCSTLRCACNSMKATEFQGYSL
jgi:hypothetical protein